MELSAQDVRDVRFGITRLRAGYNMAEVDAFLDVIEAAVGNYSAESQRLRDEADALRSQIHQLQARLSAIQAELDECREFLSPDSDREHDTIVTEIEQDSDTETTAENPVIRSSSDVGLAALLKVRDDVQLMLREQLQLVENLQIEAN